MMGKKFETFDPGNIDLKNYNQMDVITAGVGGGKTYTAMKEFFSKSQDAYFALPTRSLAGELFIDYGKHTESGLSTGEVKAKNIGNPYLNRTIGIYESFPIERIKKGDLNLLIIDEVHFITEKESISNKQKGVKILQQQQSRGLYINNMIKTAMENQIKVIGLTATPTLDFVQYGVNVHNLPPYKNINREFRVSNFDWNFNGDYSRLRFDYNNLPDPTVLKKHKFIIFANSIKNAELLASHLKEKLHLNILPFHASQNPRDRIINQANFIDGKIHGLVATDIAASGINLPAELVFIPELNYAKEEHPEYHFQQMLGRAGRPKFSNQAIIYTAGRIPSQIPMDTVETENSVSYPQINLSGFNFKKEIKSTAERLNADFATNFVNTRGSTIEHLTEILIGGLLDKKYKPFYDIIKYELISLKYIRDGNYNELSEVSKRLLDYYNTEYNPANILRKLSGIDNDPNWKWTY